jgi:hypothetical protein
MADFDQGRIAVRCEVNRLILAEFSKKCWKPVDFSSMPLKNSKGTQWQLVRLG